MVRGTKFEVFGTSNSELRTSDRAFLACLSIHASRSMAAGGLFQHPARSLADIAVRGEAKEVRPEARPQARKNRRCIRWNTWRIFSAENDAEGRGSFAAVE